MKNYLTLVLALAVVSSPAFASRARLESLGQSKDGSYFVDDSRNIFLNPAQLTSYKKKLWLEFGNTSTASNLTGAEKIGATSLAQGGFSNTFGDYTYALYVNRVTDRLLNTLASGNSIIGGSTLITPSQNLELFFAGEGAVKWGASIYWAGGQTKTGTNNATSNALAAKLGVTSGALEVFTTVGIMSSFKNDLGGTNNANEVKGKLAIDLAATYAMDNAKYRANFSTFGSKINQLGTDTVDASVFIAGLGAGWKKEVSKSVTMWTITGVDYQKNSASTGAGLTNVASTLNTYYNVPLTLAAEAQALSWLTVRGALSGSVIAQNTLGTSKDSIASNASVGAGVGMTFGDVQVDGVVGSSASALGGIGYISPNKANTAGTFGFGDNFVTRLALTYNL